MNGAFLYEGAGSDPQLYHWAAKKAAETISAAFFMVLTLI